MDYYLDDLKRINRGLKDVNTIILLCYWILEFSEAVTELFDRLYSDKSQDSLLRNQSNEIVGFLQVISWIGSGCSRLNKMFKQPGLGRINLVSMFLYRLYRLLVLDLNMITDRLHQTILSSTNVAGSDNPGSSGFDEADVLELYSSLMDLQKKHDQCNSDLRLVGLLTRLKPSLTRKNTSNSTQQIGSEEPQPSNQTIDPESIDHQSEFTAVSILSSQQMTVVNLQHSSSSSLPVSLRLPLSPTTRPRLTPKSKLTNTTKPTAIRPHTPDLTNSRPKSPSQINLANLVENWGGGGPSELSYRLPDTPSPISAFEINLSTQSNNSQSSLNHSLNQDQRCPMYHQPKTVDPKPLANHDLPQRTLTIQALPPSEHPESNRSNTPGQSWPENLPNHQLSSKLEIERKDEDSEEEDTDDDFLGNEELYSAQTHLSPKDEILPISGPLREALPIIVHFSSIILPI
ncbi:hypothetical protein PPACK8108_LOCUS20684 [Phakopsora pachyrhizi]|uniref:Uncharacterized protein n=1 Tax=Phakopsora pachyrhizi TaxID=170000 RepID=A0AAV0BFZ7_PHAPC|nr:hypothetical protein PPACK8108_LOCUS20684 [Phakopsora pachyrhizi]